MKAFPFDFSDIMFLIGLILVGYGLFLFYNLGFLLVIIGITAINLGLLGASMGKTPKKR
jgi:hypothetical protein